MVDTDHYETGTVNCAVAFFFLIALGGSVYKSQQNYNKIV